MGEATGDTSAEEQVDETPEEDDPVEDTLTLEDKLPLDITLAFEDKLPSDDMLKAEDTLEFDSRLVMVVLWSSCSDSVSVLDWSRLRRQETLDLRLRA